MTAPVTRPPATLDSETADRSVGNGLIGLGLLMQVGLLDWPYARWTAALLPVAGALVVLLGRPLGNRLLAMGLAALGGLLLLALWRFEVFFRMLCILCGVILVVAGILRHRGKW